MEIYIITKSIINLEDGYYNEKTKEVFYKRKEERFKTINKAFVSYIATAEYIRELLVKENEQFGCIFEEKDMELWNAFFIGFHHGCRLHYKINPGVYAFCKNKNIPPPISIVKYTIESLSLDFTVLNETEEILKELA